MMFRARPHGRARARGRDATGAARTYAAFVVILHLKFFHQEGFFLALETNIHEQHI